MPASSNPARLALDLAALGWHILPLSPVSKRPLGNCPACRPWHSIAAHPADACPCLTAGGWCHGVRAATTGVDARQSSSPNAHRAPAQALQHALQQLILRSTTRQLFGTS